MCLINLSVVPPIAVVCSGGKIERSLAALGVMTMGVSCFVGLLGIRVMYRSPDASLQSEAHAHLLSFGLPRIPGEFALFGLSAIPTILVAHRHGMGPGWTDIVLL